MGPHPGTEQISEGAVLDQSGPGVEGENLLSHLDVSLRNSPVLRGGRGEEGGRKGEREGERGGISKN